MQFGVHLRKEDGGMEAIEGLIVFTLMLFVLFYIWAFGFLLYQNWAVVYVANDTASRVAQTYGYDYSDPITGFVSRDARVWLSPYRYQDSDAANGIDTVNANRAEKYGEYSLKQAGFTKSMGMDINVETVYDTIAQRHIEVTVSGTFEIPFGFALKLFGQSPYRTFTATGRAMCMDMQHYIYTTKNIDMFEDAVGIGVGSDFIEALEKTFSMIKSVGKWAVNVTTPE